MFRPQLSGSDGVAHSVVELTREFVGAAQTPRRRRHFIESI